MPDHSINPLVKNYHWGDFTNGLFEAKDQNYETVILADIDGNITESPGFNVFAVKGKTVITSDHGALSGISRKIVLEMAEKQGLKTEMRLLSK
jgi:branched-chain amino acid aminotransferase